MDVTGTEPGESESDPFGESEAPERAALVATPEKTRKETPKSGPPSVDEWQDFMGRIVIRSATNAYIILMLGEAELTDAEFKSIQLTKQDLNEMSAPLAELANKSKHARKHGRSIIAMGDSWEAVLSMLLWGRRVNRIARKHRKARPSPVITGTVIGQGENLNGAYGQDDSAGPDYGNGYNVYNPGTG